MDRPADPKNAEVPVLKDRKSWDAGSFEQTDKTYVSLFAERRMLMVEGGRRPRLPSPANRRKYIAMATNWGKLGLK